MLRPMFKVWTSLLLLQLPLYWHFQVMDKFPGTLFGNHIITARKRSLGQGNIFTPVCHSVHRGGGVRGCLGGVCVVAPGGACMVASGGGICGCLGGRAWLLWGGMCGCSGGHAWLLGGHAWLLPGGGVCGFFSFFGYNEIRSMSGRYASYWNAFLCFNKISGILILNSIK